MWSLVNRTAYAADRGWTRDKDGAEIWVVAVKATYDIGAQGQLRLSTPQVPVFAGPQSDPVTGELSYETDLGLQKAGTDVILNGQAHSPDGRPVTELLIGFRVGPLTRTAMVYGDRHWRKTLAGYGPGVPQAFASMPLGYAHAFGGEEGGSPFGSNNPLGCGTLGADGSDTRMPNVEDHRRHLRRPSDRPPVAAFGPVPEHWPWRMRHAGTYDDNWYQNRRPLLPQDVDSRSWRIAPPEQQLQTHLRGGEAVALVNLTRPGYCEQSCLRFELPRLSLGFATRFYDGSEQHGKSLIHTVILEPEWPRVSVVHHMSLRCHAKVNLLDRTIVVEKRRPLDARAQIVADEKDGAAVQPAVEDQGEGVA